MLIKVPVDRQCIDVGIQVSASLAESPQVLILAVDFYVFAH
jgi:hypothetical protein